LISMSTPYFTSGPAMAARLREIATQVETAPSDLTDTLLTVSFQVTQAYGSTPAARIATIDALAAVFGTVATSRVVGNGYHRDIDHTPGGPVPNVSVFGAVPPPVEVQRETLAAQLAELDAQIALTAAAVLTPDSPDLPGSPADYGFNPTLPPAVPVTISDETLRQAEVLERGHFHPGDERECFGEHEVEESRPVHADGIGGAAPVAVSPERVAEILAQINEAVDRAPCGDDDIINSLPELGHVTGTTATGGVLAFTLADRTQFVWVGHDGWQVRS
jgi:hypothetical protein